MELLALIVLGAIWGASFLFMRVAAPLIGPVALIQWRLIFATLFLLPFAWKERRGLKQSDYSHLLVLGLVNSAVPFTLLAYASVHLSAGFAAILNATAPFFSVIWGAALFNEKLTAKQNSGLALGFFGVWILLADKISFKPGVESQIVPVAAGLLAATCYGFAANYGKKNLQHLKPDRVAFWNCAFAALGLLPLSYAGPYPWHFEAKVTYSALALGILCTGVAYLVYFKLLARSGATKALMVTFLIPVFACLWGWIFLGELVTIKMTIGASIVFWGIWRMTRK